MDVLVNFATETELDILDFSSKKINYISLIVQINTYVGVNDVSLLIIW